MSAIDLFSRSDRAKNVGLTGFFATLRLRLAQYRVYRATLEELEGLNDRELADLNIARGQIRSIAYQAAYGA